jgi:hypothetical protein
VLQNLFLGVAYNQIELLKTDATLKAGGFEKKIFSAAHSAVVVLP